MRMKVPLYLSILVSVCLLGCKTAKQQPALVHESGQSLSEIKTLMEKGKSYFISTTQYPKYLPDNGVFLKAQSRKLINLKQGEQYQGAGGSLFKVDTLVTSSILSDAAISQVFRGIKKGKNNVCVLSDDVNGLKNEKFPCTEGDYIVNLKSLTMYVEGSRDIRIASNSTRRDYLMNDVSQAALDNLPKTYSGDVTVTYVADWEILSAESKKSLVDINFKKDIKLYCGDDFEISEVLQKYAVQAGSDFVEFFNSK